jgi:hypothetical protein
VEILIAKIHIMHQEGKRKLTNAKLSEDISAVKKAQEHLRPLDPPRGRWMPAGSEAILQ